MIAKEVSNALGQAWSLQIQLEIFYHPLASCRAMGGIYLQYKQLLLLKV